MNKQHSKIRGGIAATALAAAVATSLASPASAIVTEIDDVRIDGEGFDFGDDDGEPGIVIWDETGDGAVPRLTGQLLLHNVATECARVRLITYEVGGFGEERFYSDEECASDNGSHAFDVDLADDDYAIEAKVTVQSKISDNPERWSNVASETVGYGPSLTPSEITIARQEFDFGGGNTLTGGAPAAPGLVTWDVSDGWRIGVDVVGTLFAKNAENELARVRTRCLDADGAVIDDAGGIDGTEYSDEDGHFFDDNDVHAVEIDMRACSDPAVVEVTVAIERYNPDPAVQDWEQVGLTRAELPSVFPDFGPIDVDPFPIP